MENTFQPNAFCKCLYQFTNGDRTSIKQILAYEAANHQNPQVFEILEATGDTQYTGDTFGKAADLIISAVIARYDTELKATVVEPYKF